MNKPLAFEISEFGNWKSDKFKRVTEAVTCAKSIAKVGNPCNTRGGYFHLLTWHISPLLQLWRNKLDVSMSSVSDTYQWDSANPDSYSPSSFPFPPSSLVAFFSTHTKELMLRFHRVNKDLKRIQGRKVSDPRFSNRIYSLMTNYASASASYVTQFMSL